ncbi:4674_t:CDS:2, partial [Gigaspora margarita]
KELAEGFIVEMFLSGLKKNNAIFVAVAVPKDLNEAIAIARRVEAGDYYGQLTPEDHKSQQKLGGELSDLKKRIDEMALNYATLTDKIKNDKERSQNNYYQRYKKMFEKECHKCGKSPRVQKEQCSACKPPKAQKEQCSACKPPKAQKEQCSACKSPRAQKEWCSACKPAKAQKEQCSACKPPKAQKEQCSACKPPKAQKECCSACKPPKAQKNRALPISRQMRKKNGALPVSHKNVQKEKKGANP